MRNNRARSRSPYTQWSASLIAVLQTQYISVLKTKNQRWEDEDWREFITDHLNPALAAAGEQAFDATTDWSKIRGQVQNMRSRKHRSYDHPFHEKFLALLQLRKLEGNAGDESEAELEDAGYKRRTRPPVSFAAGDGVFSRAFGGMKRFCGEVLESFCGTLGVGFHPAVAAMIGIMLAMLCVWNFLVNVGSRLRKFKTPNAEEMFERLLYPVDGIFYKLVDYACWAFVQFNLVVDTFSMLARGMDLIYMQEKTLDELQSKLSHASAQGVNTNSTIIDDLRFDVDSVHYVMYGAAARYGKYKEFGLFVVVAAVFLLVCIGQAVLWYKVLSATSGEHFRKMYRQQREESPSRNAGPSRAEVQQNIVKSGVVGATVFPGDTEEDRLIAEKHATILPYMDMSRHAPRANNPNPGPFKIDLETRDKREEELMSLREALESKQIVLPSEITAFTNSACKPKSFAATCYRASRNEYKPAANDQQGHRRVILEFYERALPNPQEMKLLTLDNLKEIKWPDAEDDAAAGEKFIQEVRAEFYAAEQHLSFGWKTPFSQSMEGANVIRQVIMSLLPNTKMGTLVGMGEFVMNKFEDDLDGNIHTLLQTVQSWCTKARQNHRNNGTKIPKTKVAPKKEDPAETGAKSGFAGDKGKDSYAVSDALHKEGLTRKLSEEELRKLKWNKRVELHEGSGPNKNADKAKSMRAESKKQPCKAFQLGMCKKKNCRFGHFMGTTPPTECPPADAAGGGGEGEGGGG